MKYLSPEQILFIHSRLIDTTGGGHGVRDIGLLQSAAARPKATYGRKDLYPDVFQKAAALLESLANNHPFIDGNKRTAITSAAIFLRQNGYLLEASQDELERFTLSVATRGVSFKDIVTWLSLHGAGPAG